MNLLTVNEFAERVKMDPASVRIAIRKGHIYAIRPGSGKKSPYRISETEIERLKVKNMFEIDLKKDILGEDK